MRRLILFVGTFLLCSTLFAGTCTQEDVDHAFDMLNKYEDLYKEGVLTKGKYLMAERMYYKTERCADLITDEAYCTLMNYNLRQIKDTQPEVYLSEISDLSFVCD